MQQRLFELLVVGGWGGGLRKTAIGEQLQNVLEPTPVLLQVKM